MKKGRASIDFDDQKYQCHEKIKQFRAKICSSIVTDVISNLISVPFEKFCSSVNCETPQSEKSSKVSFSSPKTEPETAPTSGSAKISEGFSETLTSVLNSCRKVNPMKVPIDT